LTDIRKEIERAFHEKVKIEDEILETMRSQLTSDKAAQNTHKMIKRKRDEIKDLVCIQFLKTSKRLTLNQLVKGKTFRSIS